jgi:hypothetical protein
MREQLAVVRQRLGEPGASGRAADAILEIARREPAAKAGGRGTAPGVKEAGR